MSGFRRAGVTLLIGSAAGVGIALLLTPVLSRLVTPDTFGRFMTLSAIASVFVGVSTMRLEVAGQRVHEDEEARSVLGLGMTLAIASGVVIVAATTVAWVLGWATPLMLMVGPMVTIASTQLVGTAWLARRQAYGPLARADFAQSGGMALAQAGLAAVSPSVGALLAGYLLARLTWLIHLPRLLWRRAAVAQTWRSHREFALTAGTSAGINSLASQLPILLPALLYGDRATGWFAMAVRILSPLALVGQAAAVAALGELSHALRADSGRPQGVLRRGMRDLAVLGAVPALLAAVFGSTVVPWLLGDPWRQAGHIVSALAVGAWFQFSVAPFSQALNLSGQSRRLLAWDVGRLVLVACAFLVPGALDLGVLAAAICYSSVMVALYVAMALLCDQSLSDEG